MNFENSFNHPNREEKASKGNKRTSLIAAAALAGVVGAGEAAAGEETTQPNHEESHMSVVDTGRAASGPAKNVPITDPVEAASALIAQIKKGQDARITIENQNDSKRGLYDIEKADSGVVDGLAGIKNETLKKDILFFLGKHTSVIPQDLVAHNRNAMGLMVKTYGESAVGDMLAILKKNSPLTDETEKLASYNYGFSNKDRDGQNEFKKVNDQFSNLAGLLDNPDVAETLQRVVEKIRLSGDRTNFDIADMKPELLDLLDNSSKEMAAFLEFRLEAKKSFLPVKFLGWLNDNGAIASDKDRFGSLGYKPSELIALYREWEKNNVAEK